METNKTILVIEDDESVCQVIAAHLDREGIRVESTPDGADGLERALNGDYVMVLLDLGLHTLGGLDVCRRLRAARPDLPLIMLTSRDTEIDKVIGLELGADDYVTKPFGVYELTARIRSQLRRRSALQQQAELAEPSDGDDVLCFGELEIDRRKRRVTIAGEPVELTAKEFDLLTFLAQHPGRPFTREILLQSVWNVSAIGYADAVGSLILRLRRKIETDATAPVYILTVRGIGYRFVERSELDPAVVGTRASGGETPDEETPEEGTAE